MTPVGSEGSSFVGLHFSRRFFRNPRAHMAPLKRLLETKGLEKSPRSQGRRLARLLIVLGVALTPLFYCETINMEQRHR